MSYDYLDSFGFESRILPQIKYVIQDYWKAHPDRYQFLSQKLLRYTLLNGTRLWAGNMSQEALNKAWRAMDRIGRLDHEVTFHPYWENRDTVIHTHPQTAVSYYERPGKLLLIVGNMGKRDARDEVFLKLPERYTHAIDAVSDEPVPVRQNRIELTIPAELYRVVLLTR